MSDQPSSRDLSRLSSRNLAKYGMRRGAYDGARRRRFVLFVTDHKGRAELRREFDTKRERDELALSLLDQAEGEKS